MRLAAALAAAASLASLTLVACADDCATPHGTYTVTFVRATGNCPADVVPTPEPFDAIVGDEPGDDVCERLTSDWTDGPYADGCVLAWRLTAARADTGITDGTMSVTVTGCSDGFTCGQLWNIYFTRR